MPDTTTTTAATTAVEKVLPRWLREILEFVGGVIGWEAIKGIIKVFTERTGEKVTEQTAQWIAIRLGGVKAEDERRFKEARVLLDPNDRTRLSKRLVALSSEMNDWFRIISIQETPEKTAAVLTVDARMSDADWAREVAIMNLNQHKADATYQKFITWCKTDAKKALARASKALKADTRLVEGRIQALKVRNAAMPTTFFQFLRHPFTR